MAEQNQLPGLKVPITGDYSGLQSAFLAAARLTEKFSGTVGRGLDSVRAGFAKIQSVLMTWVAPLAAAAAGVASFAAVMQSFERAETLKRTAENLGTTVEALQKLQAAAALTGSSAQEMDKALTRLSRFLGEATEMGSSAERSLRKLGMTANDLVGLSVDEAFLKVSDALKDMTDQGQKSVIMQQIFGREAGKLASLIKSGSEAIKQTGDEAERMGRVMSAVEVEKLLIAKDSMEKLGAAVTSLTDRIAIALAPVLRMVTGIIEDWIGNTKEFDATFQAVATGVVYAIGAIRAAWQGLQLLWEGSKVVVGGLSIAFWETAKAITKAAMWIGQKVAATWDWIGASFSVTKNLIMMGWDYIKFGIVKSIAFIESKFSDFLYSTGEAMHNSGIEGIADVGRTLMATAMEVQAASGGLSSRASTELENAKKGLDKSVVALEGARAAMAADANTDTPWLDRMTDQASNFFETSVQGFKDLAHEMAQQEGGNAFSDTLARFERMKGEMEKEAVESAKDSAEKRAIIEAKSLDEHEKYLAERETRDKQAAFATWKRIIDAQEGIDRAYKDSANLNAALMAEQDRKHAEFVTQRAAREYAYVDELSLRRVKAEEDLNMMLLGKEEERNAMVAEMRLKYAKEEHDAAMQNVAMWESGMQGKLEVMQGFFSSMSVLMQTNSRKMFEVGKVAAISETIISTILGAQKAFTALADIPIVGPGLGIAAAAAATAAGMARVSQIQSTQFGSGSTPGSVGGSSSSASSAANSQRAQNSSNSNVNVTLYGESYSAAQVRGLIGAINDAAGDNMNLKTQVGG